MAVFEELNGLNINGHTEQKKVEGKELTYLSWPWAWAEVKKRFPDAHYTIWRNANGLPFTEDENTGYMVFTSVTIDGITHEMWLPVMNGANRAMKREPYKYSTKYGEKSVEAATMMDINKAIMRCLVKNLAMFGLGLYIYAGEDLPETEQAEQAEQKQKPIQKGKPENTSVTTSATLPQAAAAAEKPETPGAFLKRRIAEMKREYEPWGFDFVKVRAELVKGGVVPDIPSTTMTMEQAKQLVDAVDKFYDDRRAAS